MSWRKRACSQSPCGAILNKANLETSYMNRKSTNENEKRRIAKRASEFVENGDTIYIDYGTTTLLFTREMLSKKDWTILTNLLPIEHIHFYVSYPFLV